MIGNGGKTRRYLKSSLFVSASGFVAPLLGVFSVGTPFLSFAGKLPYVTYEVQIPAPFNSQPLSLI